VKLVHLVGFIIKKCFLYASQANFCNQNKVSKVTSYSDLVGSAFDSPARGEEVPTLINHALLR